MLTIHVAKYTITYDADGGRNQEELVFSSFFNPDLLISANSTATFILTFLDLELEVHHVFFHSQIHRALDSAVSRRLFRISGLCKCL
jgi:hypothetical protein